MRRRCSGHRQHAQLDRGTVRDAIDRFRVRLGEHDTTIEDGTEEVTVRVAAIMIHPGYSKLTADNDLAVLTLARALDLEGRRAT